MAKLDSEKENFVKQIE